ncbi:MAG: hypothetical protein WEE64_05100 [Dehalococcoidia bacterium]
MTQQVKLIEPEPVCHRREVHDGRFERVLRLFDTGQAKTPGIPDYQRPMIGNAQPWGVAIVGKLVIDGQPEQWTGDEQRRSRANRGVRNVHTISSARVSNA